MRNLMIAFTVAILVLSACGKEEDYGTGIRPEGPSYVPKDCVFQTVGLKNPSSGENVSDKKIIVPSGMSTVYGGTSVVKTFTGVGYSLTEAE